MGGYWDEEALDERDLRRCFLLLFLLFSEESLSYARDSFSMRSAVLSLTWELTSISLIGGDPCTEGGADAPVLASPSFVRFVTFLCGVWLGIFSDMIRGLEPIIGGGDEEVLLSDDVSP
jgi:hypothetical protein